MAVFAICLVLFLAMAGHSNSSYCLCKDGVGDSNLQKNIDYACGAGADCTPIMQNGPCFNPNTMKDHCNYAVNSYYQRKGQISGSCDFQGTATVSQNPPSTQSSSCVFPSSASNAGTTPPSTTNTPPSTTNTPPSMTPGSTTPGSSTPGSSTPGSTTPGSSTPGSTTPGSSTPGSTFPGSTTPGSTFPGSTNPGFGLAPTGAGGITNTDSSSGVTLHRTTNLFCSLALTLLFSGLIYSKV